MYVVNGIAFAGDPADAIKVKSVKVVSELCLLLTFATGEKRIFDATTLLQYPVYQPLTDNEVFKQAYVEGGTVVWLDGDIDVSPELLYNNSLKYEEVTI